MTRISIVCVAMSVVLVGCTELPSDDLRNERHEEPELAEAMMFMQHYSQKLGYSVRAENADLAAFYMHELEELSESVIADIPVYEGHEIGRLTEQLLLPMLERQHQAIDEGDWPAAWNAYERLITTCNACHQTTDHLFIQITPAEGDPPFNQRFAPGAADELPNEAGSE